MSRPLVVWLTLACMNVPTKVGRAAWAENFHTLVERADIFGINEAGSPRAKRLYRRLARRRGYGVYGLAGTNPVFWDKRQYELYSAAHVRLHRRATGWRARRWPGFNAARYCTVVVLKPLSGGPLVTVLNWHLVAPGPKVFGPWRDRMRTRSLNKIRGIVEHHHNAGRIVVGMGDANIRAPFDVIPEWHWVHGHGVDKLGVAPPPQSVLRSSGGSAFRANTDHKTGKSAVVTIAKKANR